MRGAQSQMPAFLINIHRVSNTAEAEAYVERIRGMGPVIDALTAQSAERVTMGIPPPKWVYSYVISDVERSQERRVGKECVSTCRSRRSPSPSKKNTRTTNYTTHNPHNTTKP